MSRAANDIVNFMRGVSEKSVDKQLKTKLGYVTSYDPKTYSVRVRLEPESTANEEAGIANPVVETNWLPLYRPYGGNGWGIYTPPAARTEKPYGDQVLIIWPDGGHGVAFSGFYNDSEQAFTNTPPSEPTSAAGSSAPVNGEMILMHPTGAWIKLQNNGTVRLKDALGSVVNLLSDGNIEVISASGALIKLTSGGNIDLESAGGATISLSGANVDINA